jgi:hypothetical protein
MHGYHGIELLQIHVGNGGELRTPSGVVHQAIEAAKVMHSMINHGFDISFDGDVGAYEARGMAELLREPLSPLLAPAGNHDPGAIGDENLGGAGADAARPARYNRNFSLEWQHGNKLLMLGSKYVRGS